MSLSCIMVFKQQTGKGETMSKETKTSKPATSEKPVALADAQTAAKVNLQSGRAALTDVIAAMLKAGKGKPLPVEQVAAAVGPTTTRADIRHTFQRAGLSARKNAVIETPDGKNWLWLSKVKGQNSYLIDGKGIDHSRKG